MRIVRWACVSAMLWSPLLALAELQGVVINGYFAQQEDAKRMVEAEDLSDGLICLYADTIWDAERPGSIRFEVAVPTRPAADQFDGMGRVALAFYLMSDDGERAECLVEMNAYRVAQLPVPGAWQLRLVDLAPWEGQTVHLRVRAVPLGLADARVLLARVRVVRWHGPYYGGVGGLSSPGPHGLSLMRKADGEGRSLGGYTDFRIDPAKMTAPPLMLLQVDCIEPSQIVAESRAARYAADYYRGVHWMALPLGSQPAARFGYVTGRVEEGRYDIIPDFTAGDGPELERMLAEWRAAQPAEATPSE